MADLKVDSIISNFVIKPSVQASETQRCILSAAILHAHVCIGRRTQRIHNCALHQIWHDGIEAGIETSARPHAR